MWGSFWFDVLFISCCTKLFLDLKSGGLEYVNAQPYEGKIRIKKTCVSRNELGGLQASSSKPPHNHDEPKEDDEKDDVP